MLAASEGAAARALRAHDQETVTIWSYYWTEQNPCKPSMNIAMRRRYPQPEVALSGEQTRGAPPPPARPQ